MSESTITHAIVDVDGVLRRERMQLPGVPELFESFTRCKIGDVILSNNSRATSKRLVKMMHEFGVPGFSPQQAMTSAEATSAFFAQRKGSETDRVFLVGEAGLWEACEADGIKPVNDSWDGEQWTGERPTHVVSGFKDTSLHYKQEIAPGWNALYHGAELVITNDEDSYRNAAGEVVPANGTQANLFNAIAKTRCVLGKPEIGMAEVALLQRLGADKQTARVAVMGDTLEQDMQLAANLKAAGWNVEAWMVLTGLTTRDEAEGDKRVDRIFADIQEVERHISTAA